MTDEGDGEALAGAIARWLAEESGAPVTVAEQPRRVSGGYDTAIWFTRFTGERLPPLWSMPLVLRVHPRPEREALARREADVQAFVAGHDYAAPRVVRTFGPGDVGPLPVQVMERAPGRPLLTYALRRPLRLFAFFERLGRLHADLHRIPIGGWAAAVGPVDPHELAALRLHLPRRHAEADPGWAGGRLAAALDRVGGLLPRLAVDDDGAAVCHGDFHPMNVLTDGRRDTVIDWTDACAGDPRGDVARLLVLLDWAGVAAPSPVQRAVVSRIAPRAARRYLAGYTERLDRAVDMERVRMWRPVHLLHDWVRVGTAPPGEANPAAAAWLGDRVEAELAANGV